MAGSRFRRLKRRASLELAVEKGVRSWRMMTSPHSATTFSWFCTVRMRSTGPFGRDSLGANERACAMFGYPLDEFVGLATSALGSTQTHTSRLALLGHIDTERESAVADFAEIEMRRKDGEPISRSTRARRVVWQGRPVVVVVAHEIPDPKLVRAELAHQRDDLQLILDAIPAFVFYKDTSNVILRVNRAVAEGIGVSPGDMVNTPTSRWYPEDADSYTQTTKSGHSIATAQVGHRRKTRGRERQAMGSDR